MLIFRNAFILCFLVATAIGQDPIRKTRWKLVASTKIEHFSFDTETVNRKKDSVKVWIRATSVHDGEVHSIGEEEFLCLRRLSRRRSLITYYYFVPTTVDVPVRRKAEPPKQKDTPDAPFEAIVPETIGEEMLFAVCGYSPKRGP